MPVSSIARFSWIVMLTVAVVGLLLVGAIIGNTNEIINAAGQWEEVGGGSASGGGISNNDEDSVWPDIVVDPSGNVYVAWHDKSSGDREIYVRKWTGSQWATVGANSASGGGISINSGDSKAVSLAVKPDGKPCAAWRDWSSGFAEVYLRCWDENQWTEIGHGSASGSGVSKQKDSSTSRRWPSMAIGTDGVIYLAWENSGGSDTEIYAAWWDGNSWSMLGPNGGNVSDNNGNSWLPVLALASNGKPYIAWQDESSGNSEIFVRRWTGSSWVEVGSDSASGGGISKTSGRSVSPTMAFDTDGRPAVAWSDDNVGNEEIFVRRWTGSAWVEVGSGSAAGTGISNNVGNSRQPHIAASNSGLPCITWHDNSSGINEIYVRCWNGTNWVESGSSSATGGGISNNSGISSLPSIAIGNSGTSYVAWGDNSAGNYEIYVRRRTFDDIPPEPTPTTIPIPSPTATPISKNNQIIMLPLTISNRPVSFVGFHARWDGEHHIRDTEHTRIGVHLIRDATGLADIDTIILENRLRYEPNPLEWEEREWVEHLTLSTGETVWNSAPPDPSWKWENPWLMPSNWSFENNQSVDIGGQQFRVTGPHISVTSFGFSVNYWKLSNENEFLFWDDGGSWTQMVHSGEIDLWYDIDTRLMLHRDITRILYYEDKETSFTVQNFINLSSSNVFP